MARNMTRLLAMALLTVCAVSAGCTANSTAGRKGGEEVDVRMGVVEEVRRVPLLEGETFKPGERVRVLSSAKSTRVSH